LPIYESGWDKLKANRNNRLFRQYDASQFNVKIPKNKLNGKQSTMDNSKQANVSRVSPPI